jgi:phosphoglycolate phosphatase-like HAD superfamily hydrolase
VLDSLSDFDVLVLDFDGVIKDSVGVKGQAYAALVAADDKELAIRIERHHSANGGISRFVKIPLYLSWAGVEPEPEVIAEFQKNFSRLVEDLVVRSRWIFGAKEFLIANPFQQSFLLLSATPEEELIRIVRRLEIFDVFTEIHGAPKVKSDMLTQFKSRRAGKMLFVGDSRSDLDAATNTGVKFALMRSALDPYLAESFEGIVLDGFN